MQAAQVVHLQISNNKTVSLKETQIIKLIDMKKYSDSLLKQKQQHHKIDLFKKHSKMESLQFETRKN